MLQMLQEMLFDLFYGVIEWLADAAIMRLRLEYELEELEGRAINISAALFAARRPEYNWN